MQPTSDEPGRGCFLRLRWYLLQLGRRKVSPLPHARRMLPLKQERRQRRRVCRVQAAAHDGGGAPRG